MGMSENSARWFMRQVADHQLSGACLSLAKTDIEITERKLLWLLAERGMVDARRSAPGKPIEFIAPPPYRERLDQLRSNDRLLSLKAADRAAGLISDVTLYKMLGFDTIHSLDTNDYEGADLIYDLNQDDIGNILPQQYDLVTNFGTLEHVFHLPNALKNVFHATKVGGHVLHGSPTNNWVDHGFYQLSPTFYYDYYLANKFRIKFIQVHALTKSPAIDLWSVIDYRPGLFDSRNHGGLDDGLYNVLALVQKTEESTWDVIPSQRIYSDEIWIHGGR